MKFLTESLVVLAMFISIMILDYIWLGIITRKFIISEFGSLVSVKDGSIQIKFFVGLITWFIIALGAYIFAVYPSTTITKTLILGAIFGFISYAIYDLTNLTFIINYPVRFALADIAWGTFLNAAIAVIGFFVRRLL
jgi:uncharacterized membrane protein